MSKWSMNECSNKSYTYTFHVGTDQNKIFLKEVGVGLEVHTVPVKHSTFPFERSHAKRTSVSTSVNGDSEL